MGETFERWFEAEHHLSPVVKTWTGYDPLDDLTRLKTPTLAIFGENDPLVPVRASVQRYDQTVFGTGRYQQTLVFPEPTTGCRSPQASPRDT